MTVNSLGDYEQLELPLEEDKEKNVPNTDSEPLGD